MNTKVTDEFLYKYMPAVDEAIIQEIEERIDDTYQFSDRFKRQMKRLIKREPYIKAWGIIKHVTKIAAVFLLVMILAAAVMVVSVEAWRVKVFDTIRTVFSDHYILSYSIEETGEFIKKVPRYVPEGYELISENGNESGNFIIYENADHRMYSLNQVIVLDGEGDIFDSEFVKESIIYSKGLEIYVYWYEDGSSYAYCGFGNCMFLLTADALHEEEIEKIYISWIID